LQDCAEVSADLSAIASATAEALAKADWSSGPVDPGSDAWSVDCSLTVRQNDA
jgi:hypothetical protein